VTVYKIYTFVLSKFYKKTIISRGLPVRVSRTPRGPRTTVWETLLSMHFIVEDCPKKMVQHMKRHHWPWIDALHLHVGCATMTDLSKSRLKQKAA